MSKLHRSRWITRRSFLYGAAATGGSLVAAPLLGRPVLADTMQPAITHGVQSGDVLAERAIIWSRVDRPSRMWVDWSLEESFARRVRVAGQCPGGYGFHRPAGPFRPAARPADLLSRRLRGSGQSRLHERARDRAPADRPARRRDIRFVFSGDEAGQGWGINPGWGGYRIYEAMRTVNPDFFIHRATGSTPTTPSRRRSSSTTARSGRNCDAREVEGRRDPGRLPRLLRLQPDRRQQAALRGRGALPGPVGRP